MIRRVAFGKAIAAGVAGSAAWDAVVRLGIWLGVPMFDIVKVLGTMVFGREAPVWEWWPTGVSMHIVVGAIWAIFYAYFFWSLFASAPIIQGLLFSLLPALLAGLIMIPQMDLMLDGKLPQFGIFATGL